MSDEMTSDLAAIREQMYWPDGSERDEWEAIEDVKDQRRALLAHIDALTAAVTDLIDNGGAHDGPCTNEDNPWDEACELHVEANAKRRAAVLAILRGEA